MKDYVAEELGKLSHQRQIMLDQKGQEIEKLIAAVSNDQVNMKKGLDEQVQAIERNLEINEKEQVLSYFFTFIGRSMIER